MTRLAAHGLCTHEDVESCRAEHLEFLDRACERCNKIRPQALHPYTAQLLRLHRLVRAGYAPGPNELSPREWADLATVAEIVDEARETARWATLLARLMR